MPLRQQQRESLYGENAKFLNVTKGKKTSHSIRFTVRRLAMSISAIMLLGLTALSVSGEEGNERQTVRARLTGLQEVPAISTSGHGQFLARLGETSLEFELTYADMEDAVVVAHVHLGQRSVNGGVMFFLCGGGGRPPCTSPSGNFSGTVTAADVIGPAGQGIAPGEFEEVLRALRSGNTYANVHSVPRFPGGEIRGQIRTDSEHNPD